jgi:hypothetical protein
MIPAQPWSPYLARDFSHDLDTTIPLVTEIEGDRDNEPDFDFDFERLNLLQIDETAIWHQTRSA